MPNSGPIYGIHEVELREGVDPREFEEFAARVMLPALPMSELPGVTVRLLRGQRGVRAARYTVLYEFAEAAIRDRLFPDHEHPSEEMQRVLRPLVSLSERWEALSMRAKTDYEVVAQVGSLG